MSGAHAAPGRGRPPWRSSALARRRLGLGRARRRRSTSRVADGEEAWHAENRFSSSWTAAGHRLQPAVIGRRLPRPQRRRRGRSPDSGIGWAADRIAPTSASPARPAPTRPRSGSRTSAGGRARTRPSRCASTTPGPAPAAPLQPGRWLGRTDFPYPSGSSTRRAALPVSGIRGYAVSVDRSADGEPCAGPDRCTDAETDLRGGIDRRHAARSPNFRRETATSTPSRSRARGCGRPRPATRSSASTGPTR